jgi:hypothetical protein
VNFDKSSILAVVFCFLGYVGYETYLNKKYPDRFKSPVTQELPVHTNEARSQVSRKTSTLAPVQLDAPVYKQLAAENLRIENNTSIYTFDQKKGALSSVLLKEFNNSEHTGPIDLLEHLLEIYPGIYQHITKVGKNISNKSEQALDQKKSHH